jgi:hypothetical protein
MSWLIRFCRSAWFWLFLALLLTATVYLPGLSGGWLLDDYPNIVLNQAVQPADLGFTSLLNAALSSTASDFKRPLASLSFALNYHASGLDTHAMKLTNVALHLFNGLLIFLLAQALMRALVSIGWAIGSERRLGLTAVLIATAWMLLPINLTGVLYVVQRMESMANAFVLLGLLGYVSGRRRMLMSADARSGTAGLLLCAFSVTVPAALGLLAKESAVMLPLYALLIEWAVFRARRSLIAPRDANELTAGQVDHRITALFVVFLALPLVIGMLWLLPRMFSPQVWATRDFTLSTRLLSEARIVLDYLHWTLLPSTSALSFYHDTFVISKGWLSPWTTLASVLALLVLLTITVWLRRRMPLAALGLSLFLGGQLLTATILPLELIYEHRNYFSSFGLMLALVPLLTAPEKPAAHVGVSTPATGTATFPEHLVRQLVARRWNGTAPYALLRHALLAVLLVAWGMQTALGAYVWGSPLRLTRALAERVPTSPRAQYDLGRSYSAYAGHDPESPFVPLAYTALEKAARLPKSSVLPEQALILLSLQLNRSVEDAWWDGMIAKLKARPPTVEDQSALRTLSICALEKRCDLPRQRMIDAYEAALAYPNPGAQLQARYGDYAWNILGNKVLGERMLAGAVQTDPSNADYLAAWITMLAAQGRMQEAGEALRQLESLNVGGRLNRTVEKLCALPGMPPVWNRYEP